MKQLTYKEKINLGFSFRYAGCMELHISCQKSKYMVIGSGFTYLTGSVLCFSPDSLYRSSLFDTLYQAICHFRHIIQDAIGSMDWYSEDMFLDSEFRKIYNPKIY